MEVSFTHGFIIQLHLLLTKLVSMIWPIADVSSVVVFLLAPRLGASSLRTLVLLSFTLVPQLLLLFGVALSWGLRRELRHLWVWAPYAIARKLEFLSGIRSLSPFGSALDGERLAEAAADASAC